MNVCERYDLPISHDTIHPHQEFTATDCPGGIDIERLIQMARAQAGNVDSQEESLKEKGQGFLVRVSDEDLYLRTGPGLDYPDHGFCPVGVFTIIDTEEADGYTWGLLKSEEGWLALEFTERVN